MNEFVDLSGEPMSATVVIKVPSHSKRKRIATGGTQRLHATAIKRIFDCESEELVGWLYEWNTGELVPRWKAGKRKNVRYE